jgi:hypothetical protein
MTESLIDKLRDDPAFFAEVVMGFEAFDYQKDLLRTGHKRVVACWGRA